MWQFMPATGRDFDLKQNVFRDDRRDVLASTRAALDYLSQLYGMFGDWHLALAAYNWGQGNVQRAIRRNQQAGRPTDYESLRMPDETRFYVPKLQAVKNIVLRPESFALALAPVANHPYFLSVNIDRDIDVELAARLAGMSVNEFKQFNPQVDKPVLLAASTPQLLLPWDNAESFSRALAAHQGQMASWTAWVLPRTMSASDAAARAGMSEAALREINRIPPRMLIGQGSTLIVPRSERHDEDVSEHLADSASIRLQPEVQLRRSTIKARQGDTLATLAKRNRVTVAQLQQWNKLDSAKTALKADQQLVVFTPVKAASTTRVAAASAKKGTRPAPATRKLASTASSSQKPAKR
jgi:membrane-bound lytic murein transglycosylase D